MAGKKKVEKESPEMANDAKTNRREFMQVAAAAAAGAAAANVAGEARADSFKETASRYFPPGQWPHHLELEWYEFPSDDPEVIEVWGYADNLSYAPGDNVSFHVSTGAPTFDIQVYRDGS